MHVCGIYLAGVVSGSLATSLTDPQALLAGASGPGDGDNRRNVSGGDTAVDTDIGIGASGFGDGGRNIGGGESVDSDSDRVGASAPGEFWSW